MSPLRRLSGRPTRSMWQLRGRQWLALARGVGRQIGEDDILGRSAELAYFFLLSVFPLLLFLTTLFGYLLHDDELLGELFASVGTLSPSDDITALLRGTLIEITLERAGWKLWFGLAVALLAASQAVLAVGRVLNQAYRYRERRHWLVRHGMAVVVTAAFALLSGLVLAIFFFGEHLAVLIAEALGWDVSLGAAWAVFQGLAMVLFAVLGFELVYNFAPAATPTDRVWLTPGAVFGVALWLGASLGFRVYLDYFGYYSRIYGSLGAVIVLLLWFYLTGAAILIGGEINSEIVTGGHGPPAPEPEAGAPENEEEPQTVYSSDRPPTAPVHLPEDRP
jgi:membrane protein